MIPLLSNVAVQDQTVVSNIVTLDNIMSGVDGSATFGYTLETKNLEVNDKQKQQYAHTHTFDIRVIQPDSASLSILRAIRDNNRLVRVSGHSPDGFFLWDEPTLMVEDNQFDEIVATALLLTHDTTIGYRGAAPLKKLGVYAGDNALALYDVLSGNGSVLNGFSLTTGDTGADGSQSGETQSIIAGTTVTENTVYLRSANIFFPFVGVPITASFNTGSISGANKFKIAIEFVQSDGTTIASTSLQSIASTGVVTLSGTAPANTVYIRMAVVAGTGVVASTDTIAFSRPMLSLGRTSFTL
jgi:hypothetical protein